MANANRWMDWQLSVFNPTIVPLFCDICSDSCRNKRDPKPIEAGFGQDVKAWQIVEDHLAKEPLILAAKIFRWEIFRSGSGLTVGLISRSNALLSPI